MRSISVAILSLLSLFGRDVLAKEYDTRFDGVTWDNENWRITTENLVQGQYQSRMSLANGYLGINVAALGPFFEVEVPQNGDDINGWPLFDRRQTFATIAGFYDSQPQTNGTNFAWLYQYGGESVISGVPHWAGLTVEYEGITLNASTDPGTISGFKSVLDMGVGAMEWSFTWSPVPEVVLDISYQMFVHKLWINMAAVQLSITSQRKGVNLTVADVLNGDCAVRTNYTNSGFENGTIFSAVSPNGLPNVTAYIYSTIKGDECMKLSTVQLLDQGQIGSNKSSIGQAYNVSLGAGQKTVVAKYIGGASSDAFADPQSVAKNASLTGASAGFSQLFSTHIDEWEAVMPVDSVDDYTIPGNGSLPDDPNIIELQIGSVVNPFSLLQNTIGTNAVKSAQQTYNASDNLDTNSIAVGGLGSDSYAGFIFWDAEVWMGPGLVVAHPEAAKQIAAYRAKLLPQAEMNIDTAFTSSQNETGKFTGGAVFPWTSGRFGNCTGTGPCFDYEYHINGDIGLELFNYLVASGDTSYFNSALLPIYDGVAYFYAELLTYNSSTSQYTLTNATDPDEYANDVDDPGYTMALIKTHLNTANTLRTMFGLPMNDTWTTRANAIDVPADPADDIILEYATMNGSISVKQADVVLVDDFLDYPNPYTLSDLDYYASRQSLNGPGMTYGVFSIISNEISPSGCSSYTYDLYSSMPYTRAPWFQYSEQLVDDYTTNGGTHPAYPFLTGMGGANRVGVFGYLGLRLMLDSLNVDPSLPPQIQNLNYRTFYWQGHPINATSNQTHTTITRVADYLDTANSTYITGSIPVTMGINSTAIGSLPPNGTLTIQNRQNAFNKTIPGNIAQCLPVTSPQDYEPGQFPVAAIDGAISTKWEPSAANTTSWIQITLGSASYPVIGFYFDWAQSPPVSYSVVFSNDTNFEYTNVTNATSSSDVSVSSPYDAEAANSAAIVPYASNTTNVTLQSPVWSGQYCRLYISGNQALNGTVGVGATVAEFAILANSGNLPSYPQTRAVKKRSTLGAGRLSWWDRPWDKRDS